MTPKQKMARRQCLGGVGGHKCSWGLDDPKAKEDPHQCGKGLSGTEDKEAPEPIRRESR